MARHKVMMKLPAREIKRADVVFNISRDGRKFGTLEVSNGAVVWFPPYTSYGLKMGWQKFHDFMRDNASRVEKR